MGLAPSLPHAIFQSLLPLENPSSGPMPRKALGMGEAIAPGHAWPGALNIAASRVSCRTAVPWSARRRTAKAQALPPGLCMAALAFAFMPGSLSLRPALPFHEALPCKAWHRLCVFAPAGLAACGLPSGTLRFEACCRAFSCRRARRLEAKAPSHPRPPRPFKPFAGRAACLCSSRLRRLRPCLSLRPS